MSAPSPLSVVIVDDDELVAQSLRTILEARGNVRVAALGTKGAEAAALFNEHHPDIMLLDIRMPDLSGLAAGEAILAAHPKARIVFLTTFADDDYIVRALAIGARGYLIKQEARGLAEALHSVMEGQIVLGSDVTDRVSALIGQRPANGAGAAFDDSLSHPDNSQAAPPSPRGSHSASAISPSSSPRGSTTARSRRRCTCPRAPCATTSRPSCRSAA